MRRLIAGLSLAFCLFVLHPAAHAATSVLSFGAKCDGVTDDSAAFSAAIANTPTGGTVLVPAVGGSIPPSGGGSPMAMGKGCVVKTSFASQQHQGGWGAIYADAVHLVGDGGGAAIKCVDDAGNGAPCIWLTDTGIVDLGNSLASVENLTVYWSGAVGSNSDTIWIMAGNNMSLRNIVTEGAGEDGVKIWSSWANGWVESTLIENVRVSRSGRDNFHVEVSDGCTGCFVTQTTFVNSTSRLPGRYALSLDSLNNQGGNYKISDLQWTGGELDCSGAQAADCVHLNQASSSPGQGLESITFTNVAIEDASQGAHTGYAVGVTKTGSAGVGPVSLFNVVYYGEAKGALDTSNLGSWAIESCANGQTASCHGQNSLQVQAEGGLTFANQLAHSGRGKVTLNNSPCASGNAQQWLATQINGTTFYIPACHP